MSKIPAENVLVTLVGMRVLRMYYASYPTLAERFNKEELRHVYGFITEFENDWIMVNAGGSRGGIDFLERYILDKEGNILHYEEVES